MEDRSTIGRVVAAGFVVLFCSGAARSEVVPCRGEDGRRLSAALERIQAAVDPCGESLEVQALLRMLQHCERKYEVCISPRAERNLFEPAGRGSPGERTITWNPTLRSELEPACDGDVATPVRRDPTASLLHELVHAVHDCKGLNPGAHELEAVRIENIYRRAVGLCQRSGYGADRLPSRVLARCEGGRCACPSGDAPRVDDGPHPTHRARETARQAADAARPSASGTPFRD